MWQAYTEMFRLHPDPAGRKLRHAIGATRRYEGGDRQRASRRCAEMTLRNLAAGGLIFSASSVAWCGALPAEGAMNDVGRITLNLLERLSARQDEKPSRAKR
jgi:hypothetical protein